MEPFDEGLDQGMGIPGWFIAIAVLAVVIGIASTLYRINAARGMARAAGLDEDAAARVALLDEDGVSAAYLASQLRGAQTPAGQPPRSVRERLTELAQLHSDGLITDEEHAERRRAIIEET